MLSLDLDFFYDASFIINSVKIRYTDTHTDWPCIPLLLSSKMFDQYT